MTNATITISNDLLTLGETATREDMDRYCGNLAALISEEFGVDATVRTGSVSSTQVRCDDSDIQERIEERLSDLEGSDEWAGLLDA